MHKISCLLILLAVLAGCARKQKDPGSKPAIPVKVAEVQSQEVEEVLQYSGNILPYKIVKFGFMDAGKVKAVHVKEGQYVHEGDLIAELDATDYRFALEAAKAQYEEARSEYKRLKTLYEKGSLTQSDYDRIKAMHREAKADYEYKQKQL
ncbi:MAG: biotin/lipoyl-binding protein, partial [Bacteroidales bacterium]|nr:biotin/lipoyl-binding protein [Bacteroidales bacterium]